MRYKLNISFHIRPSIWICLFLVVAIMAVYWQVLNHDFINYDDDHYVTENQHVRSGLTWEGIVWAFTTFEAGNWHPLTWMSHMFDCTIYGLNPVGHHLTNLQFHIANTLLLFIVLNLMTKATGRSAVVAALFALHPLHVESVAWISERKDVLSSFWFMLGLLSYYNYITHRRLISYLPVIACLILGLMAKSMLVTFPFLLLLLDFWPLNRFQLMNESRQQDKISFSWFTKNQLRILTEKIPLFIIILFSSFIAYIAQKSSGAISILEFVRLSDRISNAFVAYLSYLIKMIWPHDLVILYLHPALRLSNGNSIYLITISYLTIASASIGALMGIQAISLRIRRFVLVFRNACSSHRIGSNRIFGNG